MKLGQYVHNRIEELDVYRYFLVLVFWCLISFLCKLDLLQLACSGTTTTTRPTASATLTTGATRPPGSSPLDLWQLLASPSSQLSSDDFVWEAFFTKSLPIGRLGSLAMANAIISPTCLSCLEFWQLEKKHSVPFTHPRWHFTPH